MLRKNHGTRNGPEDGQKYGWVLDRLLFDGFESKELVTSIRKTMDGGFSALWNRFAM